MLAGCFGGPGGQPAAPESAAPGRVIEVATPYIATPGIAVAATELGDPGVLDRLAYRTRVVTWGPAWWREDGREPVARRAEVAGGANGGNDVRVLDVARDRVRIVVDDDGVRYGVWIARGDTATVPLATIQLADRDGRAVADNGAWIEPGADVDLGAKVGKRREVTVRDSALRVRGYVPLAALGEVWKVAPATRRTTSTSGGQVSYLSPEVTIRAAPDAAASVVAVTAEIVQVEKLGAQQTLNGWQWIEIVRRGLRVRGYVPGGVARDDLGFGDIGTIGGGHGFGISDTDPVTLPVGACLFDRAGGQVIGVNLVGKQRVGGMPTPANPGWWLVYVDSPWSAVAIFAHDASRDPRQPQFETCGGYAPAATGR